MLTINRARNSMVKTAVTVTVIVKKVCSLKSFFICCILLKWHLSGI